MPTFNGFTGSETFTQIPGSFFRKLLNEIDDLAELKVTLYAFWRIEQMEGGARFLCRTEFAEDADFMRGLGAAELDAALEKAVRRGSLLNVESEAGGFYFLNTPRGRAAVESMQKGDWSPSTRPLWRAAMRPLSAHSLSPERPNIFKLYEENIGPLTPLIADALRDAEATYPAEWIEEAVGEAVKRNKRNWKYVEAILHSWKEKGHAKKQDRQNAQEDGRRYSEGEFAEYLKRD